MSRSKSGPNGDAYAQCEKCHDRRAALQRRRLQELKAQGICVRCRKRRVVPPSACCYECAEKQRLAQYGGKPRKYRKVPIDEDDGMRRERTQEDQAVWDAHRAAINAVTNLSNARPDDPDLRRAARALYSSGAVLAEEMR